MSSLRPQWRFRRQRLESLSYASELRLLRRTTLLISLFGSSLHNCRFLPEGAIVIQIHGALKGEVSTGSAHQYRRVCEQQMGLRFAAYAVPGWRCDIFNRESLEGDECAGGERRGADFTRARVEAAPFTRFLAAALAGNFSALASEYAAAVGVAPWERRGKMKISPVARARV